MNSLSMKYHTKRVVLLFVLASTLSLSTYSSTALGAETDYETIEKWEAIQYVDEFGDVVADSDTIFRTSISGDFSNTATTSSELGGYVFVAPTSSGEHYTISFRLLEYGEHQATFVDSDELILKTKVDDVVEEYILSGASPNSDLYLGTIDVTLSERICNYLYDGKDIRCIIYIGNSKYNFTLESGNFSSLYQKDKEDNKIDSTQDVLKAFFMSKQYSERTAYINTYIDDYPIVSNDELKELIVNHWLTMTVETMEYDDWWVFEYTNDGRRKQIGRFENGEYKLTDELLKYEYIVENGILYVGSAGYSDLSECDGYQFRKMQDGYYLVEQIQNHYTYGDMTMHIFVEYDESGNPAFGIE